MLQPDMYNTTTYDNVSYVVYPDILDSASQIEKFLDDFEIAVVKGFTDEDWDVAYHILYADESEYISRYYWDCIEYIRDALIWNGVVIEDENEQCWEVSISDGFIVAEWIH